MAEKSKIRDAIAMDAKLIVRNDSYEIKGGQVKERPPPAPAPMVKAQTQTPPLPNPSKPDK
jgi:hypothetical protein